jgi:hypothetical protein
LEGEGLEHLALSDLGEKRAEGVVIGSAAGQPFALRYLIRCDADWRVRELAVNRIGGPRLRLIGDGAGGWRNENGVEVPALAGCIDVDIAGCAFTNTLPIRRLGDRLNERTPITVAYVQVPELAASAQRQAYTRLAARRYHYEGVDDRFSADIEVDGDGIVLRYPPLFERLP